MSTIETVTLKELDNTSVVYDPHDNIEGQQAAVLRNANADGIPKGDSFLTLATRRTASGRYVSTAKLSIPQIVTDTSGGAAVTEVARVAYADVKFTFDAGSTEAERASLVHQIGVLLDQTSLTVFATDTLVKLEVPRG